MKIYETPEMILLTVATEGFLATSQGEDGFYIPPYEDGVDIVIP